MVYKLLSMDLNYDYDYTTHTKDIVKAQLKIWTNLLMYWNRIIILNIKMTLN